MNITIGGTTLDSKSTPIIKVSFDYFKSKSGVVLGGNTVFNISGTITVGDDDALPGASVMTQLKSIREIGKTTDCVSVTIPGFYTGQGKISNVNIDQGPDPSWVNQGGYSIEIKTPLDNLPPNSLGITKDDFVSDLSISESIEIGEDAHGFSFLRGEFSKSFVRFTNKTSVTCKPLCPTGGTPFSKAMGVLRKVVKNGPQNPIFNTYKGWRTLLQDRSIELNSEGGVTFSATLILMPPSSSYNALVDINFSQSQNYESEQETRTISGTVTGLAPIAWSDLVSLSDSCSSSKLAGAESAFAAIKSRYNTLGSWAGTALTLRKQPNCPDSTNVAGQCGSSSTNDSLCLEPINSVVSKNRTEGSINFSFEWSTTSKDNCSSNGNKTEITVDIEDPQPTLVEHTIVRFGTLIQDINCKTAKRVSGTLSITSEGGGCPTPASCNSAGGDLLTEIAKYTTDGNYYEVGRTETTTLSSYTLKLDYVKAC